MSARTRYLKIYNTARKGEYLLFRRAGEAIWNTATALKVKCGAVYEVRLPDGALETLATGTDSCILPHEDFKTLKGVDIPATFPTLHDAEEFFKPYDAQGGKIREQVQATFVEVPA